MVNSIHVIENLLYSVVKWLYAVVFLLSAMVSVLYAVLFFHNQRKQFFFVGCNFL